MGKVNARKVNTRKVNILKRTMGGILAFLFVFVNIVGVFADVGGDDNLGGGEQGWKPENTMWNDTQQGYRFYLVNADGKQVSKSVDVLKSVNRMDLVQVAYNSNRFENLGDNKPGSLSPPSSYIGSNYLIYGTYTTVAVRHIDEDKLATPARTP